MLKTTVIVPVTDNEGREFPQEYWNDLGDRLVRFGGHTRTANVAGVWVAGDRTYRDTSHLYTVSLGSWTQVPEWLDLVHWIRETFRQEAIYMEIAGLPEVIAA